MLADLWSGLVNGFGFMFGILICYTIYDGIFTLAARHAGKTAVAKRKKRRRN